MSWREILEEAGLMVLAATTFLFIGLFLSGCTTTVYPSNALIDQILRPRAGFEGKLTNRSCLEYDGQTCVKDEVKAYDLSDEAFRKNANELQFVCKIANKRYKICLDKPGFCRFETKGFFKKKQVLVEYLEAANYQFLIDGKARCFNRDRYSFSSFN